MYNLVFTVYQEQQRIDMRWLVSVAQDVNPIWHGLFEPSVRGGGGIRATLHNFVVIVPMIKKFGTGIKLDVFYTEVKKLLRHYHYVIMTS